MAVLAILTFLIASPDLVNTGYVNDAQCAKCHADIALGFSKHGMGRSFWVPGPENAIADFSEEGGYYHHERSGLHYRMRMDDEGRVWMRQYEVGVDGVPTEGVELQAHYAVGSGNHARTYLYQSPSGELWELPVTWYTGRGWRMSPGYDTAQHQGFGRQIGRGCIFCHTAYPSLPEADDRAGRPMVFPQEMPLGIGCQRCHGPGASHIKLAYSVDATDEEIAGAILNPVDLPEARADEICLQCHLQPSSRLGSIVRPFDRGTFSYRPGEPLSDYLAHIDFEPEDPGDRPLEINHHPYQLDESACVKHGGRIGCLSCHDPHHKLSPADIQARTRTTCLSCHQSDSCQVEAVMRIPRAQAQDCARCHMPHEVPEDVIHTRITNHRIQKPSAPSAAPTHDGPPAAIASARLLREETFREDPHADRYPILGEVMSQENRRVAELDALVTRDAPVSTRLLLAEGLANSGNAQRSRDVLEPLILDAPWAVNAHVKLAALDLESGDAEAAVMRMRDAVSRDPQAADAWKSLAVAAFVQGRTDEAVAAAERACRLRPQDRDAFAKLGTYLAKDGLFTRAAAAFQRAEALIPGDASTGYNLGLAWWKSGDRPRAAAAWRHALVRSPADPRLQRMNVIISALPWPDLDRNPEVALRLAADLYRARPSSADATAMLAVAMLAAGRTEQLSSVLQQAARLKADLAVIRLLEAWSLAALGEPEQGRLLYRRVRSKLQHTDLLREGLLNQGEAIFGD